MKILERLKVFETISSAKRISSIDIFRSLAILAVVLFHFNGLLPKGYLGVDLFFVISGFLIGGILTKEYKNAKPIHFFKFILQRGFKVWPSYYVFFVVGSLLARFFYQTIDPGQIIRFNLTDMPRYLFFYQNYTGAPWHYSFDHVWSLCIEEHFYILLPILFIVAQRINKRDVLFAIVALLIFEGIASKFFMFFYTNSKDTYCATNNRIDALAWGVLLNFAIVYADDIFKAKKNSIIMIVSGVVFLTFAILADVFSGPDFFDKVLFHSIVPPCFALIIGGAYYYDFSKWKPLRFIAYYSYNWYLWHPIFVKFILFHIGYTGLGLFVYLILSFLFAILFTIFVEEKFLARRDSILNKLFNAKINYLN